MKIVLSLLLVCLQNLIFGEAQTCTYAVYGSDHTMCKYTAKACPPGMLGSGVTDADKTAILTSHNNFRKKVATGGQAGQPSATNMEEMKWDPDLATVAQRWADQCSFGHDANRRTATFPYVGQNVAMTGSTASGGKVDFPNAVTMWYNEVTKPGFSSSKINPFQYVSGAGHYTQVVWATSNRVGCGYSLSKQGSYYQRLYVCNYGPGGNVVGAGSSMYKTGTAASACTKGKSTAYVGLCNS